MEDILLRIGQFTWTDLVGIGVISVILTEISIFFSKVIYEKYKDLLLWVQTFGLRYGHPPYKNVFNTFWGKAVKKRRYRQPRGLVGIIAVNFKKVKNSKLSESPEEDLNAIYFVDKDGDYENRNTHLSQEEISAQHQIITKYYDKIGKDIEDQFDGNSLFQYYETENSAPVRVDVKLKDIYSLQSINFYIDKVNREMLQNNAIHFIGDKIGVKDFNMQGEELELIVYKTDHFTWQVFKEIFKANKSFFQEIILRINHANWNEKKLLIRCLAFVFSSFGIDIIIESKDCAGNRKLIISARSGKIETNSKSSLHVSVNETFSRTDFIDDSNVEYGLYECVRRGIQEEIGIPVNEIDNGIIKFHDFAVVTDEGEIGLSCHVDFSNIIPAEKIVMYPGQDKYLESEDLLILPYFNIRHIDLIKSVESVRFMRRFYKTTLNDRFSMPWMSFTPLLISRVFVRNIKFSIWGRLLFFVAYWIFVFLLMRLIYSDWITLLLDNIVTLGMAGSYELIRVASKKGINNRKRKYSFIQPFVSQWYGNAKVAQATGYADGNTNNGVHFIFEKTEGVNNYSLLNKELKQAPYCTVRRKKGQKQYSEVPVSFFKIGERLEGSDASLLNFRQLNLAMTQDSIVVRFAFEYVTDSMLAQKKIKKIRFSSAIEVGSSYIGNNVVVSTTPAMNNCYIKGLSDAFSAQYCLHDLFVYDNDYYWSCIPLTSIECENRLVLKGKNRNRNKDVKMSFYDYALDLINKTSCDSGIIEVSVKGNREYMEMFLNSFIQHPNNKRRISELDLYMMQLSLIRSNEFLLADIEYNTLKIVSWFRKIVGKPKFNVFLQQVN